MEVVDLLGGFCFLILVSLRVSLVEGWASKIRHATDTKSLLRDETAVGVVVSCSTLDKGFMSRFFTRWLGLHSLGEARS